MAHVVALNPTISSLVLEYSVSSSSSYSALIIIIRLKSFSTTISSNLHTNTRTHCSWLLLFKVRPPPHIHTLTHRGYTVTTSNPVNDLVKPSLNVQLSVCVCVYMCVICVVSISILHSRMLSSFCPLWLQQLYF